MESKLKESIIKHLEYQKSIEKDPEKPFMCCPGVGKDSWTVSEVIEEVKSETKFGEDFADMVIGSAIYSMCAGIDNIYDSIRKIESNNKDKPSIIVYQDFAWEVLSEESKIYRIILGDNIFNPEESVVIILKELVETQVYRLDDYIGNCKYSINLGPMSLKSATEVMKKYFSQLPLMPLYDGKSY